MKKEYFMSLFDYLDNRLEDCDHHMTLTMAFLNENGIENVGEVLAWLREKGGYCDCEVLNVEEQFEFLK